MEKAVEERRKTKRKVTREEMEKAVEASKRRKIRTQIKKPRAKRRRDLERNVWSLTSNGRELERMRRKETAKDNAKREEEEKRGGK